MNGHLALNDKGVTEKRQKVRVKVRKKKSKSPQPTKPVGPSPQPPEPVEPSPELPEPVEPSLQLPEPVEPSQQPPEPVNAGLLKQQSAAEDDVVVKIIHSCKTPEIQLKTIRQARLEQRTKTIIV